MLQDVCAVEFCFMVGGTLNLSKAQSRFDFLQRDFCIFQKFLETKTRGREREKLAYAG